MNYRRRFTFLGIWLLLRPVYAEAPVFFPSLPEQPRIQYLRSYSTREDVGESAPWLVRFFFGTEKDDTLVERPYGIAALSGRVYVCDTQKGDVRILDLAQGRVGSLSRQGVKLKKPINIAIDAQGYKFVTDTGLHRVIAFDPLDRYWKSFGTEEDWQPVDVALFGPSLYVVDILHHRVSVFDRASGKMTGTLGAVGSEAGKLFMPTNITVDAEGHLYVADTMNFRVQEFSTDGKLIRSWGQAGRTPGTFSRPKGVAVDRENRLYVVDAAFENVQIFNDRGETLLFFGESGNEPGQMTLPAKVALDYDPANLARFQPLADPRLKLSYLIWVTNQYGPRRVSVYGFGDWQDKADAR